MSDCRWCKGTGKYYPLVGEAVDCLECKPNESLKITSQPDYVGISYAGLPVVPDRFQPLLPLGIAVSSIQSGSYGWILVRGTWKGGLSEYGGMQRSVKAKRDISFGNFVYSNDIEPACTPLESPKNI